MRCSLTCSNMNMIYFVHRFTPGKSYKRARLTNVVYKLSFFLWWVRRWNCITSYFNFLPHSVLDTLIEPTAQQGGGVSPPQHDLFLDIVDVLYVAYVTFFRVTRGTLVSKYLLYFELAVFIQVIRFKDTWSSAVLLDAVKVSGTLKEIRLIPCWEDVTFPGVVITALHCGRILRSLCTMWNKLENPFVIFAMVSFVTPPGIR